MQPAGDTAPLIAHIIYRLDIGGLENGLVNLINHMPADRYRHAIICLTDYTDFYRRIRRADVEVYALHKNKGLDWKWYLRLWRLLRQLRPAIVHTRNLATLEGQVLAALARVRFRIHGEHGWDVAGPRGAHPRHHQLRRCCRPFVSHYIALSREIADYLQIRIGVSPHRVAPIYNGVDSERFHPGVDREPLPLADFALPGTLVIGTVGRMQAVKDPLTLVRAFLRLLEIAPDARTRLRLVMIGDGPLRRQAIDLLTEANAMELAWLPGARDDVPALLRGMDLFVLPSLAEGISNTILEAMASGLPVVATRVGGNAELIVEGETGRLVPANDPEAMAAVLRSYVENSILLGQHGEAARRRVERYFSMELMVSNYLAIYDAVFNNESVSLKLSMRS